MYDFITVEVASTPIVRLFWEYASSQLADIPGLTIESLLRSLAWCSDADVQPEPDGVTADEWQRVTNEIDAAIKALVEA